GDPQAIRDLTRAAAFGARQDDPRPRRVTLCAGGGAHPRGQFCGFFERQLERQRRSSTSRRGTHLGELPYRSLCEMYSNLKPAATDLRESRMLATTHSMRRKESRPDP